MYAAAAVENENNDRSATAICRAAPVLFYARFVYKRLGGTGARADRHGDTFAPFKWPRAIRKMFIFYAVNSNRTVKARFF